MLLYLTYEGLSRVTGVPEMQRLLAEMLQEHADAAETARSIAESEKRAERAQTLIDTDFSMLHAHTLMGLWGALESGIADLVGSWMDVMPDVLDNPSFRKVVIPIADWERASSREDQRRLVASKIDSLTASNPSAGIKRFEEQLKYVALDGPVDPRVSRAMFEVYHYRNVIAHRSGIADRRFVEACPDLGYKIGDPVKINRDQFAQIFFALGLYVRTVRNRCLSAVDREPDFAGVPDGWEGALDL